MKTRASWIFVSALAFGVVTTGCSKEEAPKAEGSAAPVVAAGGTGLADPTNDPGTVALVKAAIEKCDFKNHGFSTTCADWKKVVDSPDLKKGAQDKTLVNFLADPEEKVRWIGANRMISSSGATRCPLVVGTHDDTERNRSAAPLPGAPWSGVLKTLSCLGNPKRSRPAIADGELSTKM